MKKIVFLSLLILSVFSVSAQDFVAVAKTGNVYDEPSAKYITVNQDNADVAVIPGMVFAMSQHTPGWYKIEYSPGLHAFIPDQIAGANFVEVKPGTYDIANNSGQQITISGEGDQWTAASNGKTFKGKKWQDIIVFYNDNNNIAYSVVDLGNGPIAITYDNSVTKFF